MSCYIQSAKKRNETVTVSLQANRTKRHAKLSWYVLQKSKQEEKNVNQKRATAIQSR